MVLLSATCLAQSDYGSKAYVISQEFVKEHASYPETTNFPLLDYVWEPSEVNSREGTLIATFTAKNAYGTKIKYAYKMFIKHITGDWRDKHNWRYSYMVVENASTREQKVYKGNL